jgi:hypothetical protein
MIPDPQVGVLGRLAGAAHRRRVLVVVLWLAAVVAAVGLSQVASGDFKADYTAAARIPGPPRTCWPSGSRPRPASRSTSWSGPTAG